jgi:hypothetical protein
MANVTLNQLLEALRGKLGHLVFRRRPDGRIIVSGTPRYRKGKGSPKQKAHRQRVKSLAPYAKVLAKTHPVYAELAAASDKWLSPYNMALADCLVPPVIQRIERSERQVRVEARDNIGVVKVWVTVRGEDGGILAAGQAAPGPKNWWEFPCPAEGRTVVAEAWDLPGNVAKLEAPSVPIGTSPPNPKGNVG